MPSLSLDPQLSERLGELSDLGHAGQLMAWDQQVMMPAEGAAGRGEALATISRMHHDRLVDPELATLLDVAAEAEPLIARAVRRDHDVARRVPGELTAEMSRAGSDGYAAWLQAREANDYAAFEPALRRNIELARRYAACFPEAEHPYDPLLDRFEPGTTAAQVSALFERLRAGLVPLLSEIALKPAPPGAGGRPPDRRAARDRPGDHPLDGLRRRAAGASTMPCTRSQSAPGRGDVRVTSRFDDHSLTGLFALMHEVGHGLYEDGVDPALARTTLDSGVSLGVHESQSRLWENLVGRSPAFWSHWLPRMRERFPLTLRDIELDAFIRAVNVVRPTLIRVEADEVTYSLHVILRFELELALIDGTLDAADLPAAWAAKMKQFLGIEVPDDLRGVLQDIHWSEGIIGYFPTYAIGNVLAAQLWRAAHADLPSCRPTSSAASCRALRAWLRDKIHRHGRLLTPPELIEQAVGGPLDPAPMLEHLRAKYGALYEL